MTSISSDESDETAYNPYGEPSDPDFYKEARCGGDRPGLVVEDEPGYDDDSDLNEGEDVALVDARITTWAGGNTELAREARAMYPGDFI